MKPRIDLASFLERVEEERKKKKKGRIQV